MDAITWKEEEQPNMRRTKNLKTWILPRSRQQRTMGQNQVILRHGIIHFPTSEGVSKVSERASGRASGPVLTSQFLFVPDHSAAVGRAVGNDTSTLMTMIR